MSWYRWIDMAMVFVVGFGAVAAKAQSRATESKPLIVGTKQAPPFSIRNADGSWSGISIDLWRDIAAELQLPYQLRERDLQQLLDGLEDGSLDMSVAALTITAERETAVDFTHPFHTSGLGIAIRTRAKEGWMLVLERFFSADFLKVLTGLALVLFTFGLLVWLFERRRNPEQFGGKKSKGLSAGFWWSAVTMTTVGYGDKAPVTAGGRLVALVWMFTSVIIISSFTAAITSALTVSQLESPVVGPEDLPKVRVATVANSTSADFLRRRHIAFSIYDSPLAALQAVAADEIDALVYDAPILRYFINDQLQGVVRALPQTFERQDYGIALREGSDLREEINRVLLDKISQPQWQERLRQYMGR